MNYYYYMYISMTWIKNIKLAVKYVNTIYIFIADLTKCFLMCIYTCIEIKKKMNKNINSKRVSNNLVS